MYIKILDLLVFNRIRFINTVIIKSISSTTGHVHLYAMHIGWTFGIKSKTYTYVLEDQVIISQIQAKTDPPIRLAIQYILLLPGQHAPIHEPGNRHPKSSFDIRHEQRCGHGSRKSLRSARGIGIKSPDKYNHPDSA